MLPRPPAFDRIKNIDHHDLIAEYYYFWCLRSPDVKGSKLLIKMARPQNIMMKGQCFVAWSSL